MDEKELARFEKLLAEVDAELPEIARRIPLTKAEIARKLQAIEEKVEAALEPDRKRAEENRGQIEEYKKKLTRRQQQALDLLIEGKSNKEIAEAMGVSVKTAEMHAGETMKRIGVTDRAKLKLLSSR